jgi:hypothetical protein
MGHGGVYEVDRHGRPEPSVGGGELKFSSIPWGQEPPPTLHFLSLWAGRRVSLSAKSFSAFFRSDGTKIGNRTKRFFLF